MKTLIVSLMLSGALAQGAPLDLMVGCEAHFPHRGFSIYRDPDNRFSGFLFDYDVLGHPVEHPVDIQYTNAGARAIFSSEEFPNLILVGGTKSVVNWNGRKWKCQTWF